MPTIRRAACMEFRASLARVVGLGVLVVAGLVGCAGTGRTPASEAYAAGNYRDAYYNALAEQRTTGSATARAESGLTAGLAAYAMAVEAANDSDRDRWLASADDSLAPLADHPDATISGRALATMGLGDALQNEFGPSADKLSRAALRLSGDEAARANLHAGLSYDLAGSGTAARRSYQAALGQATDPALKSAIEQRLAGGGGAGGGFTIQIGAFSTPANAQRAATDASRRAQAAGLSLGSPRIIAAPGPSGRTLHRVQMGQFATRNEALAARVRFAPEATVTVSGR